MNRIFLILLLASCLSCIHAGAQNNQLVTKGNKLYQDKKYPEAAKVYKEALIKNPGNTPGMFNLGNALFQQKNYDAARQVMTSTAKNAKDKQLKAGANYNIGNTYMQEQKWEEAVNAYKEALRVNPQDEAAKYNLSYALAMMKKQQGGGGKDKDKNKDKNEQNKDNQQNKDNKDNKDQQNKDQQNKDQQNKDGKQDPKDQQQPDDKQQDQSQPHPQPQPSKLTEKQAEQLLNALQQEEKKLQDKRQKGKGIPVKVDKDW